MPKLFSNISDGQRVEVCLKGGEIREGNFRRWTRTEVGNYLTLKCDEYIEDGQLCKEFCFLHEGDITSMRSQLSH